MAIRTVITFINDVSVLFASWFYPFYFSVNVSFFLKNFFVQNLSATLSLTTFIRNAIFRTSRLGLGFPTAFVVRKRLSAYSSFYFMAYRTLFLENFIVFARKFGFYGFSAERVSYFFNEIGLFGMSTTRTSMKSVTFFRTGRLYNFRIIIVGMPEFRRNNVSANGTSFGFCFGCVSA